jgi:thiamine-phosphate pyrophosphorylase
MEARQQTWPRIWLMTDERMGERLWDAVRRLPASAGIVLRHYSLTATERANLAQRLAAFTRDRGLTFGIAGDTQLARAVGADFVHNPRDACGELLFSRSVHNLAQTEAARADGAALVFVSPVYSTRSHPGSKPLGEVEAVRLAETAGVPAIALGGMNAQNFAAFSHQAFHGWAGIDAWL